MPRRYTKQRIDAALDLLEEAAKEKSDELKEHVGNRYSHIRHVFVNGGESHMAATKQKLHDTIQRSEQKLNEALEQSNKILKESAGKIEKNLHENPMPFLGTVAVFSLAIGFLLGRREDTL